MSGGVDSSVSAILLKEQGYEVIGATMSLWDDEKEEGGCGSSAAVEDAKKVCEILGISHYVFDFRETFQSCVIRDFIECYQNAMTPNPCIECNKYLKFRAFYQKAQELGCEYMATGHYAKVEYCEKYQQYVLKAAKAEKKDQSYVLYNIPKDLLPHILFPLSDFDNKDQIRELAMKKGLTIANKPDSQEICFIPDNDYGKFLREYGNQKVKTGNIVNQKGEVIGKHKGLIYFTIGQRKGLGITWPVPLYVIELDPKRNEVVVGEEKELYTQELVADQLNYLLMEDQQGPIEIKAKIRYSSKPAEATLYKEAAEARVKFKTPQRAVTKGQSVVFYIEDSIVLGGGKIK